MENKEIVKRLIGEFRPTGESEEDRKRFENLKELCTLLNDLISEIEDVKFDFNASKEFSLKRASDYADEFLTETLGIQYE